MNKILCPAKLGLATFRNLCQLFQSLRRRNLCPDPPNLSPAVYVRMVSATFVDLGEVKHTASKDSSIKLAVSLSCHCELNRWQIITKAGSH